MQLIAIQDWQKYIHIASKTPFYLRGQFKWPSFRKGIAYQNVYLVDEKAEAWLKDHQIKYTYTKAPRHGG